VSGARETAAIGLGFEAAEGVAALGVGREGAAGAGLGLVVGGTSCRY
jgi:hypothetical protein